MIKLNTIAVVAFPGKSPDILARFPPSLLITSTRDFALSSVVQTHRQLVNVGVETDLHIWDGLGHGVIVHPDLPESREVFNVMIRFFNKHLGRE